MTPGTSSYHSGFIALIGRPNSGKSTLLNTVLGQQLSVVTPLPQTTRRNLKGIHTDEAMQLVFIDTPGMHKGGHDFNKAMLGQGQKVLREKGADLVVYVVDLFRDMGEEEDMIAAAVASSGIPVLVVFNKADVSPDPNGRITAFRLRYPAFKERPSIKISAMDPAARMVFLDAVRPFIPEGPQLFPPDDLTDENMRFFAAEYLQKGIILSTREEVPHACFVEILGYREEPGRHHVDATIHVETDGQKGIIVGKKGSMIGRIRTIAENELGRLAGVPVTYSCHVKVSPGWRDDQRFLSGMGYGERK